MSRRQRLHIRGGTYYVVQHGNNYRPVFSQPEDYALFERLLASTASRTGTRIHAYCWTTQAIHFVAQIEDISVGRFMQGVTSRYARSIHQTAGESGHFFKQRYKAVLIDPEAYLAKLSRYLHHLPLAAGLTQRLDAYPYSSHRAYLGESEVPWLSTRAVLRSLSASEEARNAYVEFMSQAPAQQEIHLFEHGGANDLRVIGSPEFLAGLPRHARTYRSKTSLDQIINTVTCTLGVEREHVLSSSRQRQFALARALIAWYATERGIATLSEVARRLHRDPSTLSVAVSRYRVCRPELFRLTGLHDVVSLSSIGAGSSEQQWSGSDDLQQSIA